MKRNMNDSLEIAERMAQTAPVDNPMPPRRVMPLGIMKRLDREKARKRRAELRRLKTRGEREK